MSKAPPRKKLKQSSLIDAFKKQESIPRSETNTNIMSNPSSFIDLTSDMSANASFETNLGSGGVMNKDNEETGIASDPNQEMHSCGQLSQTQQTPTCQSGQHDVERTTEADPSVDKEDGITPPYRRKLRRLAEKVEPDTISCNENSREDSPSSPKKKMEDSDDGIPEKHADEEPTDSQLSTSSANPENMSSQDMFGDSESMDQGTMPSCSVDYHDIDDSPARGIHKAKLKTNPECAASLSGLESVASAKVLYKVSKNYGHERPSPNTDRFEDLWDKDHVRMPFSSENMYPIEKNGKKDIANRWDVVKTSLLNNIQTSHDLEGAMLSYNTRYIRKWDFSAMHCFFNEELTSKESKYFFKRTLPAMVELALKLPKICGEPIPLLRKHRLRSIHITQEQAASLLANAFFCTFPRRNTRQKDSEYATFPDINFNSLYMGGAQGVRRKLEKLKCIIHYFKRVTENLPPGSISFRRQVLRDFPKWDRSVTELTNLHITARGSIEDDGIGMLQVDFANKYVGGGVLGRGAVQEEIRFLICPEMILSRLFTEVLDKNECLIMTGCERFSNYIGYADSFEFGGEHNDPTPSDEWGRKFTEVVAIDALIFRTYLEQFEEGYVTRELNKAYCGFLSPGIAENHLSAVATGNWGCGAFGGDLKLKALIQIMAASEAKRDVCYFTFGDRQLRNEIHEIHKFVKSKQLAISDLWALINQYSNVRKVYKNKDLYEYIYSVYDEFGGKSGEDTSNYESDGSKEMQQYNQSSPDYQENTP